MSCHLSFLGLASSVPALLLRFMGPFGCSNLVKMTGRHHYQYAYLYRLFFVPDDKKRYMKDNTPDVLATLNIGNKQLTSIVGMLMSSAAVYMAPLYISKLYHAMGHDM